MARVMVDKVNSYGIHQRVCSARVEDNQSATVLMAMIMAGADRGRAARLYRCSGWRKLLLCLLLFRTIFGIDPTEAFGESSCGERCMRIGFEEKNFVAAEGVCCGGNSSRTPADIQVGSGTHEHTGNSLQVIWGFQPALVFFRLAMFNLGLAMTRPR